MSYKDELLKQMSDNLNINKFLCEDEKSYSNRVLYSVIANWIYTSAQDISFNENYNKKGVSKSYITRRVSKIIDEYLELFPDFCEYLDGKEPNQVVREISEIIESAGFLIPTGFDEFVSLPLLKNMKINKDLYLVKGLCKANEVFAIGLGLYTVNLVYESNISIKKMFYIPEIDAKTWTKEYINTINWRNSSNLGKDIQFFDPKSRNRFCDCWKDTFPSDVDVTIYKNNNWDYGFAKNMSNGIRGVKIPDYLIGIESSKIDNLFDNDVRRFMYGLKAFHKNNAKSKIVIEKDICALKIFNQLPKREFTAIQFMGWRKKTFSNELEYYIPLELLAPVKELLTNLNIVLEEVQNG